MAVSRLKRFPNDDKLSLTRLRELLSYDRETGLFTRLVDGRRHKAGTIVKGTTTDRGYIILSIDGVKHRAHRVAWLYETGSFPSTELDHENNLRSDNRFINLREATRSGNLCNRGTGTRNKSGYKGVHYASHTKRFKANIYKDDAYKFLGYFATAEEAAKGL